MGFVPGAAEEALAELGQAVVDWFVDTGDCHLCRVTEDYVHDKGCPVDEYLREHGDKRWDQVTRKPKV
jgi:hypothetical protein